MLSSKHPSLTGGRAPEEVNQPTPPTKKEKKLSPTNLSNEKKGKRKMRPRGRKVGGGDQGTKGGRATFRRRNKEFKGEVARKAEIQVR